MATQELGAPASRPKDGTTKSFVQTAGSGSGGPAFTALVGDGVSQTVTVAHNLGTTLVDVSVFRATAPFEDIDVRPERTDKNTITFHNDEVWGHSQYIAMVRYVAQSDATPPSPGTLAYSSSDSTSITYTFSGQSDAGSGIASIDAYDGATNQLIQAGLPGSTWTRQGLAPNTSYSTYLNVVDNAGNSAVTATVTHTTAVGVTDTTNPTPGNASFISATNTTITYAFTAATDNVGVVGVDAYDSSGTLLQANVTSSYVRQGLTANTSYGTFFRYRDAAGNHADSNTVTHSTTAVAADVALNAAGTGARTTDGSMPAGSITVANTSTNRWALCWVTVSHSTSNNPATYDTATLASNIDGGNWTYFGAIQDGPFSGQKQGAVLLFYKQNPGVGTHTLTPTIAKAGLTFTSVAIDTVCYDNVGSIGTPVTIDSVSNSALNLSLSVAQGNMAACCMVSSSAPAGGNGTVRYSNGSSVTGTGDYTYVQDFAGNTGGGAKAFTTTSAQVHSAMAVELQKAA